jgi:cell division protein FtsB
MKKNQNIDRVEPIDKRFQELFGLSLKIFLITAIFVIIIGIYIANLIYGDNSLHRLEYLQNEKKLLTKNIYYLKQENAKLHKQYLEWEDAQ